jgi:hypothetical protein
MRCADNQGPAAGGLNDAEPLNIRQICLNTLLLAHFSGKRGST